MDIRIGVTYSAKELDLELAEDTDRDALKARVDEVLGAGEGILWVTDRQGREVAVPAARITYVDLGSADAERRIGFAAG